MTRASPSSSNDPSTETNTSAANVVAANPLFANNAAFAAVLADSLTRQGSGALVSGEARTAEDEFGKEGPIEEVLASCLRDQRQAVVQLENLEKAVKSALERERKQFERLQFAFKKAGNDRAYAQSLAKLRKRYCCSSIFECECECECQSQERRATERERTASQFTSRSPPLFHLFFLFKHKKRHRDKEEKAALEEELKRLRG